VNGRSTSQHEQTPDQPVLVASFSILRTLTTTIARMSTLSSKRAVVAQEFYRHYQHIYKSRWPALAIALERPASQAYLVNPFAGTSAALDSIFSYMTRLNADWTDVACFLRQTDSPIPNPGPTSNGLRDYYALDASSLLPVKLLNLLPGDRVLDMCASPGGKSLAILFTLHALASSTLSHMPRKDTEFTKRVFGHVVCNERDPVRRARLQQNLKLYLPADIFDTVRTIRADGRVHSFKQHFDKVLVDAPCSTPRHSRLAPIADTQRRQVALLRNAIKSTRPQGRIVYSTCSMDPYENDRVVQQVLNGVQVERKVIRDSEETEYGRIILPDVTSFGPMYVSILTKL